MATKVIFQFEIIINVLVSSFRLISIYLCCGSKAIIKQSISYSAGTVLYVRICRRQILTYKDDPRAERVKEVMRYFVFQRRNNIQYMYIRNLEIFAARSKSNIQM